MKPRSPSSLAPWPNGDDDIKPGLDPAPATSAPSSRSLFERGESWSLAFLIGDDHPARIAKLTADPDLLEKILIAAARAAGISALEAREAEIARGAPRQR